MVEISDIQDEDSLRDWLQELRFDEDENRRIAVNIAHRAAMRVLPDYWRWANSSESAHNNDITALPILRVNLFGAIVGAKTTALFKTAAVAPASAATSAADAPARAAAFAADDTVAFSLTANAPARAGARAAAYAARGTVAWHDIRSDCRSLFAVDAKLDQVPIWSRENPKAEIWRNIRQTVNKEWQFWIDWYQDALDGVEPNWDMLTKIALIEPKDWDKGADHVNGLIAGIVKDFDAASEVLKGETAPEQVLAENANVIRLQLDTLKLFVEEEIQRLRAPNNIADNVMARIVLLEIITVSVAAMQTVFTDGTINSENALVVVGQNLPHVIEAAEALAENESATDVSETIVTMGAAIDYLTKRGTPGYLATGIAALDMVRSRLGKWFKGREASDD